MIKKTLIFILVFTACSIGSDNSVKEIIIETTMPITTSSITSSTTTTPPSTTVTSTTTTTTTTTIPKKIFISKDHPSEREDIPSSYQGYGDFIERLPGYEGDSIQNLEILSLIHI